MQARNLTQRVTIERNNGSVPDGHGEPRPKWEPLYFEIPASVRPLTARELWSAAQVKNQATHKVMVRFAPGITSQCRVLFENRTFTIDGVLDINEQHSLLELSCLEQVS